MPAIGCRSQRCRQNPARRLSSSPTPDPGHFQLRGPRRSKSSAADRRLLTRGQRQRGLMIAQAFALFASRSTQKATITLSDRANLRSAHPGRRFSAPFARRIARLVSASTTMAGTMPVFQAMPTSAGRGVRSSSMPTPSYHDGTGLISRIVTIDHIATRPCLSDR